MLAEFLDDPQASANHLVLGLNLEQRQQANANNTGESSVPNWRCAITHLYRGGEGWTQPL